MNTESEPPQGNNDLPTPSVTQTDGSSLSDNGLTLHSGNDEDDPLGLTTAGLDGFLTAPVVQESTQQNNNHNNMEQQDTTTRHPSPPCMQRTFKNDAVPNPAVPPALLLSSSLRRFRNLQQPNTDESYTGPGVPHIDSMGSVGGVEDNRPMVDPSFCSQSISSSQVPPAWEESSCWTHDEDDETTTHYSDALLSPLQQQQHQYKDTDTMSILSGASASSSTILLLNNELPLQPLLHTAEEGEEEEELDPSDDTSPQQQQQQELQLYGTPTLYSTRSRRHSSSHSDVPQSVEKKDENEQGAEPQPLTEKATDASKPQLEQAQVQPQEQQELKSPGITLDQDSSIKLHAPEPVTSTDTEERLDAQASQVNEEEKESIMEQSPDTMVIPQPTNPNAEAECPEDIVSPEADTSTVQNNDDDDDDDDDDTKEAVETKPTSLASDPRTKPNKREPEGAANSEEETPQDFRNASTTNEMVDSSVVIETVLSFTSTLTNQESVTSPTIPTQAMTIAPADATGIASDQAQSSTSPDKTTENNSHSHPEHDSTTSGTVHQEAQIMDEQQHWNPVSATKTNDTRTVSESTTADNHDDVGILETVFSFASSFLEEDRVPSSNWRQDSSSGATHKPMHLDAISMALAPEHATGKEAGSRSADGVTADDHMNTSEAQGSATIETVFSFASGGFQEPNMHGPSEISNEEVAVELVPEDATGVVEDYEVEEVEEDDGDAQIETVLSFSFHPSGDIPSPQLTDQFHREHGKSQEQATFGGTAQALIETVLSFTSRDDNEDPVRLDPLNPVPVELSPEDAVGSCEEVSPEEDENIEAILSHGPIADEQSNQDEDRQRDQKEGKIKTEVALSLESSSHTNRERSATGTSASSTSLTKEEEKKDEEGDNGGLAVVLRPSSLRLLRNNKPALAFDTKSKRNTDGGSNTSILRPSSLRNMARKTKPLANSTGEGLSTVRKPTASTSLKGTQAMSSLAEKKDISEGDGKKGLLRPSSLVAMARTAHKPPVSGTQPAISPNGNRTSSDDGSTTTLKPSSLVAFAKSSQTASRAAPSPPASASMSGNGSSTCSRDGATLGKANSSLFSPSSLMAVAKASFQIGQTVTPPKAPASTATGKKTMTSVSIKKSVNPDSDYEAIEAVIRSKKGKTSTVVAGTKKKQTKTRDAKIPVLTPDISDISAEVTRTALAFAASMVSDSAVTPGPSDRSSVAHMGKNKKTSSFKDEAITSAERPYSKTGSLNTPVNPGNRINSSFTINEKDTTGTLKMISGTVSTPAASTPITITSSVQVESKKQTDSTNAISGVFWPWPLNSVANPSSEILKENSPTSSETTNSNSQKTPDVASPSTIALPPTEASKATTSISPNPVASSPMTENKKIEPENEVNSSNDSNTSSLWAWSLNPVGDQQSELKVADASVSEASLKVADASVSEVSLKVADASVSEASLKVADASVSEASLKVADASVSEKKKPEIENDANVSSTSSASEKSKVIAQTEGSPVGSTSTTLVISHEEEPKKETDSTNVDSTNSVWTWSLNPTTKHPSEAPKVSNPTVPEIVSPWKNEDSNVSISSSIAVPDDTVASHVMNAKKSETLAVSSPRLNDSNPVEPKKERDDKNSNCSSELDTKSTNPEVDHTSNDDVTGPISDTATEVENKDSPCSVPNHEETTKRHEPHFVIARFSVPSSMASSMKTYIAKPQASLHEVPTPLCASTPMLHSHLRSAPTSNITKSVHIQTLHAPTVIRKPKQNSQDPGRPKSSENSAIGSKTTTTKSNAKDDGAANVKQDPGALLEKVQNQLQNYSWKTTKNNKKKENKPKPKPKPKSTGSHKKTVSKTKQATKKIEEVPHSQDKALEKDQGKEHQKITESTSTDEASYDEAHQNVVERAAASGSEEASSSIKRVLSTDEHASASPKKSRKENESESADDVNIEAIATTSSTTPGVTRNAIEVGGIECHKFPSEPMKQENDRIVVEESKQKSEASTVKSVSFTQPLSEQAKEKHDLQSNEKSVSFTQPLAEQAKEKHDLQSNEKSVSFTQPLAEQAKEKHDLQSNEKSVSFTQPLAEQAKEKHDLQSNENSSTEEFSQGKKDEDSLDDNNAHKGPISEAREDRDENSNQVEKDASKPKNEPVEALSDLPTNQLKRPTSPFSKRMAQKQTARNGSPLDNDRAVRWRRLSPRKGAEQGNIMNNQSRNRVVIPASELVSKATKRRKQTEDDAPPPQRSTSEKDPLETAVKVPTATKPIHGSLTSKQMEESEIAESKPELPTTNLVEEKATEMDREGTAKTDETTATKPKMTVSFAEDGDEIPSNEKVSGDGNDPGFGSRSRHLLSVLKSRKNEAVVIDEDGEIEVARDLPMLDAEENKSADSGEGSTASEGEGTLDEEEEPEEMPDFMTEWLQPAVSFFSALEKAEEEEVAFEKLKRTLSELHEQQMGEDEDDESEEESMESDDDDIVVHDMDDDDDYTFFEWEKSAQWLPPAALYMTECGNIFESNADLKKKKSKKQVKTDEADFLVSVGSADSGGDSYCSLNGF